MKRFLLAALMVLPVVCGAAVPPPPATQPSLVELIYQDNVKLHEKIDALTKENEQLRSQLAKLQQDTPRTAASKSSPATRPSADASDAAADTETHVGPRGGVYHYSKNGNKVYTKKK